MARKTDDFTSAFEVHRKHLLNMEKRALPLLTKKSYFRALSRPVESRDELGRVLGELCLSSRELRVVRKHSRELNDRIRKEGKLDGRSPMSIVASIISLVAQACNVDVAPRLIAEICGVQKHTISHVSSLISSEASARTVLDRLVN